MYVFLLHFVIELFKFNEFHLVRQFVENERILQNYQSSMHPHSTFQILLRYSIVMLMKGLTTLEGLYGKQSW